MAVEAYLPTLAVVVTTGVIDSINPCAIGVLILMVSVLLGSGKSVGRMLVLGGLYIAAVYVTYFLAGLGLIYVFTTIPLAVTEYVSITVGLFIVFAGVLEIKDYFWYGRGLSLTIPDWAAKKMHRYARRTTIPGILLLGVFVSAVELPCTGAPYMAIVTLLSQYFDFTAFLLLVLYNLIFVAPLIVILLLVASGLKLYHVKRWKQENRGLMRLFIGLTLVGMGWLLVLIANGTLNFG